jgi:hypothetical protein
MHELKSVFGWFGSPGCRRRRSLATYAVARQPQCCA